MRRARPLCRDGVDKLRVRLARSTERHIGGDQPGALQLYPADGGTARHRQPLSREGQCVPLPEELHQAVRRDFFGRPLRPGGQRTGGETGAGGQPAAPGGDFHLRTLEKNGFLGLRGVLAIKELRKRTIFFLQKAVKAFAVLKNYTIFALAINQTVR